MNKTAKILGLKDTRYGNPHGLPNIDSRSTVLDIANLITLCMKNDTFS
jgi:D-alanyl-D-alanine carboxypeptidase